MKIINNKFIRSFEKTFFGETINPCICNYICENRYTKGINMQELNYMMEEYINIILLDVRSPQEFNENHLYRAILLPEYELEYKIEQIVPNKESAIIAYCRSGIRSTRAIQTLENLGYRNLYYLKGGLEEYI